jgi:hypothetical protein
LTRDFPHSTFVHSLYLATIVLELESIAEACWVGYSPLYVCCWLVRWCEMCVWQIYGAIQTGLVGDRIHNNSYSFSWQARKIIYWTRNGCFSNKNERKKQWNKESLMDFYRCKWVCLSTKELWQSNKDYNTNIKLCFWTTKSLVLFVI